MPDFCVARLPRRVNICYGRPDWHSLGGFILPLESYMGVEVIAMFFMFFAVAIALAMFVGSLALMEYGRRLGLRRLATEGNAAMAGLNAVEGAVFALMGLLLAFTLSGALQRFDERRLLIMKEANVISTTHDRFGLLEEVAKTELRAKLKEYLQERLKLFRMPIGFSILGDTSIYDAAQLRKIAAIRKQLWDGTVEACERAAEPAQCNLILSSLNEVNEAARDRAGANERHPPRIIYVMLFALGLGGSLLAGFGMGAAQRRSPVHMVIFAAAMSTTLYIITDIEFPRQGLITVKYFDRFLEQVLASMT